MSVQTAHTGENTESSHCFRPVLLNDQYLEIWVIALGRNIKTFMRDMVGKQRTETSKRG